VTAAWTVRNSEGELLSHLAGRSRMDVARKIVSRPFDAFRLEVSSSYREAFNRDLSRVLERQNWQVVSVRQKRKSPRRADERLAVREPEEAEWPRARSAAVRRKPQSAGLVTLEPAFC